MTAKPVPDDRPDAVATAIADLAAMLPRRTVVACAPEDEAMCREAVEQTGLPGLFVVSPTQFVEAGTVVAFLEVGRA